MLRPILTSVTRAFITLGYRIGRRPTAINVVRQLRETRRVLIYMPTRPDYFEVSLKSLQTLKAQKPKWHLTLALKKEMVELLKNRLAADTILYSMDDQNLLGLPKDSLKKHLRNSSFDLAIDLTFGFDLLATQLCRLSSAPLRVCFDIRQKSVFYNFGIRVHAHEALESKYNAMVKYIAMIAETPSHGSSKAKVTLNLS